MRETTGLPAHTNTLPLAFSCCVSASHPTSSSPCDIRLSTSPVSPHSSLSHPYFLNLPLYRDSFFLSIHSLHLYLRSTCYICSVILSKALSVSPYSATPNVRPNKHIRLRLDFQFTSKFLLRYKIKQPLLSPKENLSWTVKAHRAAYVSHDKHHTTSKQQSSKEQIIKR